MSPTSFDEQRARRGAAVLADVAAELRSSARSVVEHAARIEWAGGARRRHDVRVGLVAEELIAIAARLEEIVDEVGVATVRARHLAAFRRAAAQRAASTRLGPRLPAAAEVVGTGPPSVRAVRSDALAGRVPGRVE